VDVRAKKKIFHFQPKGRHMKRKLFPLPTIIQNSQKQIDSFPTSRVHPLFTLGNLVYFLFQNIGSNLVLGFFYLLSYSGKGKRLNGEESGVKSLCGLPKGEFIDGIRPTFSGVSARL
jgi:hypothetical protein